MNEVVIHSCVEEIKVRQMIKEDLAQVQAIDRISFSLPWPAKAFEYELKNNIPGKPGRSIQWVAECTNLNDDLGKRKSIFGMIIAWFIIDEVHIATLAVHPDHRRKGIARTLVSHVLQEAQNLGFNKVTLEVRAGNLQAQELYKQFGFKYAGVRRRYYKDNNEDAYIMNLQEINPGGKS